MGKLKVMRRKLSTLPIEIVGLKDMEEKIPDIEETGSTLLENAQIKAKAYYEAFGIPVFSCDTSLRFVGENFPQELQPGMHTRRISGREYTDEEMIAYYRRLIQRYGEQRARYENAICFYLDDTHIYQCQGESLWGKTFLLGTELHEKYQPGFPLDGLSKELETGIPYYDLSQDARDEIAIGGGVTEFFQKYI